MQDILSQKLESDNGLCQFFGFVKVPFAVLSELGQASMTLAGLCSLPYVQRHGKAFCELQTIADAAGVPLPTVKRHIRILTQAGVVRNHGRQHRRTVTLSVNPDILKLYRSDNQPYMKMPRFCFDLGLSFSERLVLAFLCYRGHYFQTDKQRSVSDTSGRMASELALSKRSVVYSLNTLHARKLIDRSESGIMVAV